MALVTGGAVRVGRAICRELADAGFAVGVNYHRSATEAEDLVAELEGTGRDAVAVAADVSDPGQVEGMVERILRAFGRIDLLVNNAAIFGRRPFLELDPEVWDETLSVNLTGPFLVGRRVAAAMVERGGGRIVNVGGIAGMDPIGDYAAYCVSKAGVDMLTRCMAEALAPEIQVNGVAPGTVLFPEGTDETTRREVVDRIPFDRIGEPEDVARTIRFLAEGPEYITGTVVRVDGGASLHG